MCLRKGHLSRECKSTGRCRHCKGHHHSSICEHSSSGVEKHQVGSTRPGTNVQSSSKVTQPGSVQDNASIQNHSAPSNTLQSAPCATPQNLRTPITGLNPAAPTFTSTPSTSFYAGSSQVVLLQTAIAKVYNPNNPSSTLKVQLILDSGSQHSYLTEQVKNTLGLQRVKHQELSILTFGSSKGDTNIVHWYCY